MLTHVDQLASYHHAVDRIRANWSGFLQKRDARLEQERRHGTAAEKVAENILEDLFTEVLDWSISDLNNQIGYADILLTRLGIKFVLIEVKRPGALAWSRHAVDLALDQACRYAGEQRVKCVAVSDGVMLYAADLEHGGLRDRVLIQLDSLEAPGDLWWLSVHGIYRPHEQCMPLPQMVEPIAAAEPTPLLHNKYKLPAHCFAYISDPSRPETWKLPYRNADGSPDIKRLPKAIQAILSNYRGAFVHAIPEKDIPDVLVRLASPVRRLCLTSTGF